ncbi:MAG TPA: NAD(P)H-binding protein, partial [Rugosimonospora sp.]|nr:NAD(P)H-binding protein [Rugosimonospora sp.]
MYVVIGATGNTGSVVAEKLLAKREKVRVVGRDERKLERFKQKGAEAFAGDVTDASAMARAFSGAEAAYVMVPPNLS